MKTSRIRKDSKAASRRRQLKVAGQSIDVLLPAPMAAALDEAAREEFIANAVREKIAREQTERGPIDPLLQLENARAQADAFTFLLIEFINHNADGLTLKGETQMGLIHLRARVHADLEKADGALRQQIRGLKGGAR
jgi:hypothetical protein